MPTQNRAICSHNLPRLSRSPLIPSHDGSAAAAAAHKSAAPIGARGVLDGYLSDVIRFSDEIRVPLARGSRRPTRFPLNFLLPSYVFYGISCLGGAQNSNSGRLRAQILETLCELCSLGAQNPKSGHLWTQILDTLCKSCCLGAQNSKPKHLWTQILNTLCKSCSLGAPNSNSAHSGPILLRTLLQTIDQFGQVQAGRSTR